MSLFSLEDALGIALPGVEILDVGAMQEGEDRYEVLRGMNLARVTGFEPDEAQHAKLETSKRGEDQYLPYFLGSGDTQTFYVARYPGCSSLYRADSKTIDPFTSIGTSETGNFTVTETMEVQTRRLDDIAECPAPDFIKLDVQGAELDILRHGIGTLESALVVESEVEFIPLYENQPLFGDMQVFMREQGLLLHKFIDIAGRSLEPFALNGNRYAATSQLLWADAVFVRDFTKLECFADEQLLKAALILHQVYYSYDLVHLLLKEYDARTDASSSTSYMQALSHATELPLRYMNLKEHV
jgi:FkbM family methyltransferase